MYEKWFVQGDDMVGKVIGETEDFVLTLFSTEDAVGFYELNLDPQVMQYTGDQPFSSVAQAQQFIADYNHYTDYGFGRWSVYRKVDLSYVGFCGLRYLEKTQEVDIGFRIARKFWGRGVATKVATETLRLGFEQYSLEKIVARTMQNNVASIAVLKKLNFLFEDVFVEDKKLWRKYSMGKDYYYH